MDCDELSDEDQLAVNIYSVCTAHGFQNSFSERNLIELVDGEYDRGYTESELRKLNKTLAQVLQNSEHFRSCGRGEWKAISAGGQMDNIHDSVADNKNAKKGGARGRGGAVRGRGAAVPRNQFNRNGREGFRGFNNSRPPRGGLNQRGAAGSHGSSFRPQENHSNSQPDYLANQRPLGRNGSSNASNQSSNYDGSFNRDNSRNSGYQENVRPQSPPRYRRSSRPPSPRSRNSNYYDRDSQRYNNDSRYFDNDRREYQNDKQSNYGGDQYGGNERYGGHDNGRRSPPPMRYDDTRYNDYRQNSYERQDRYNDGHGYNNGRPSSPQYRQYSPPRNGNGYRDDSGFRMNEQQFRHDSRDEHRGRTPPLPNRLHNSPPSDHRQRRSDSRNSNGTNFSQFSEENNDSPPASKFRTEYGNTQASVQTRDPITVGPSPANTNPSGSLNSNELLNRKLCKQLLKLKKGGQMDLTDFVYFLKDKGIIIPGDNYDEQENYLCALKESMPEFFKNMTIDRDESLIIWNETEMHQNKENEDEEDVNKPHRIDNAVWNYIKSISTNSFKMSDVILHLVQETGEKAELIKSRVAHAMFYTHQGEYRYVPGEMDLVQKIERDLKGPSTDLFSAPLVHPAFSRPQTSLNVTFCFFRKFAHFAVRPVEAVEEFEKMEKEIKVSMQGANVKEQPNGGWQPRQGCLVRLHDSDIGSKWARGMIIKEENKELYRVYVLDFGYRLMVRIADMAMMPQRFLNIPPFCITCKVNATNEEHTELNTLNWKPEETNNSDRINVSNLQRGVPVEGIPTFTVDLATESFNGGMTNILDKLL
ncbi:hypothetical protein L5515_000683 [Caenorhabditis briggsae]|uniref:Tudor domain-containing protein n=1 Tax=Caenorhabditis briggsae TaxID=6238 RepID=A0AAE9DZ32_CAEBR|nr:hypothetical protein L5515_000683 [Caenorhabditis briggsae]